MGNMGLFCSAPDTNSKSPKNKAQESLYPMPKVLLSGCRTAEEHYQYIESACCKVANLNSKDGLDLLGFEYLMWHNPQRCSCNKSVPEVYDDDKSTSSQHIDEYEYDDDSAEYGNFEYTVPIDKTLTDSFRDRLNIPTTTTNNPNRLPKVSSAASMFSLTTHHTNPSLRTSLRDLEERISEDCAMRLYHFPTGTLITKDNLEQFVAYGKMYNEVSRLCMEFAQEKMKQEGKLEWETISNVNEGNDKDDKDSSSLKGVSALVSERYHCSSEQQKTRNVLVAVTGKGQVGAGIFSRRHLMTTGIEVSTALPFIREAVKRDMEIVLLDPNAQGGRMSMKVVEKSLEGLFFRKQEHDQHNGDEDHSTGLYVLAHSMAGSQLVRFLHNKTTTSSFRKDQLNGAITANSAAGFSFLKQIKAVAFTDSNHNINWTKDNPPVTDLLVGPSSLYIKSHRVHEDAKILGQAHHDCHYWKRRFGDIKTIWAGTNEHALTNFAARKYIWDHFDDFLDEEEKEDDEH